MVGARDQSVAGEEGVVSSVNTTTHNLSTADVISGLFSLCNNSRPVQPPFLDVTYGNAGCWPITWRDSVIGCDLQPSRAKDVCCSFLHLPFRDCSVDMVVFDPPFQPFVGSREERAYSGMGKNEKELKLLFKLGLSECWRVCSLYLIVKCQHYVHNHEVQWMPLWAVEELGYSFEYLVNSRDAKVVSSRWNRTLSLRRNHADYLLFCKKGNKR